MNVNGKIDMLRRAMNAAGFHAYIITGSDPYGSEVPPERWQSRKWISGFTGSAGIFAVTGETSGLWVDERYWLQAEQQLAGTQIQLFKIGGQDVPSPEDWLTRTLPAGSIVGVDGQTLNAQTAEDWEQVLTSAGIHLDISQDLMDKIWTDRPPAPEFPVVELTEEETGESCIAKLQRLRTEMHKHAVNVWLATAPDSIAWLLNIRGNDIPNTPAVLANMIVKPDKAVWYTKTDRISQPIIESLAKSGVLTSPTERFLNDVEELDFSSRILLDKSRLNCAAVSSIPAGTVGVDTADPVYAMKARKNSVELNHLSDAMISDGVALIRFFMDVESCLKKGKPMDELLVVEMLYRHRSAMPGFLGNSFPTIAAVGKNSALCHYIPCTKRNTRLDSPESTILLVDSGAQWATGTTDVTRMIALKPPSNLLRRDYTLVLKAHIAVSRQSFPVQTKGYQLDAIGRSKLWMEGIEFGHGVGHGVGFRLGVHEGPQVLNPKPIDVCLEPGMIVSNEPGLYREDRYGIRIENLLVCQKGKCTEFGQFYCFKTLTLAPYSINLINTTLLNADEIEWINNYHIMVKDRLTPFLTKEETAWLCKAASPINANA